MSRTRNTDPEIRKARGLRPRKDKVSRKEENKNAIERSKKNEDKDRYA